MRLREDILAGELLSLSKLHISNLRQRYETSVGPIREALSRLSGEGLVNKRGQRGHWVAPVSLEVKKATSSPTRPPFRRASSPSP